MSSLTSAFLTHHQQLKDAQQLLCFHKLNSYHVREQRLGGAACASPVQAQQLVFISTVDTDREGLLGLCSC